jgi:ABC-2 type transport system ATP-binding protein
MGRRPPISAAPAPTRSAPELPAPAVRARSLTRRFGDRVAFQGVDLEVARGEVFGLLGPNGAGKTTMVRVLGTLLVPSSGTAEVAGFPVGPEAAVEIRRRISIMPEAPGLYQRLSVGDNLRFFAGLYGLTGAEADRRVAVALDQVSLKDREHDRAGSLSKGLRQRAALARALLNDPEVLFLDEPTSGLDPEATREVRDLIEGLRARDVTVVLTTHRLEEAARLCDRVAIINGCLLTVGRPHELAAGLFQSSLDVRLACPLPDPAGVFRSVTGVTGWEPREEGYRVMVEDPPTVAPRLVRALVAAGADVVRVAEDEHSLEDVYLHVLEAAT